MSRYLLETGQPQLAQPLCNTAHEILEQAATSPAGRLSSALLGMVAGAMGDYERSILDHWRWIGMLLEREDFPPDYELAYAYCEFGIAQANFPSQADDSQQSLVTSMEIFRNLPDFQEHWLTTPRTYLGLLYCVQHRLSDAGLILQQALTAQRADPDLSENYPSKSVLFSYVLELD
jgi:hypothetical protein